MHMYKISKRDRKKIITDLNGIYILASSLVINIVVFTYCITIFLIHLIPYCLLEKLEFLFHIDGFLFLHLIIYP